MAQRNPSVSRGSSSSISPTHPNAAGIDFCITQLAQCHVEIDEQLQRLQAHDGDPARGKKRGRARNAPKFDLRKQLFQMCGVDLTRIDGIDVTTAWWLSARPAPT